jgi:hypothetical protein
VHLEPAVLDRELEAGAVLGRAAAVSEQKRLVDFLDVYAALELAQRRSRSRGCARLFRGQRSCEVADQRASAASVAKLVQRGRWRSKAAETVAC